MKKIVFVIERLFGGGAERVTAVLMNELCSEAEIHLVSTYDHNEADEYPTDARIIKHTIGKPPKNWILLIFQRVMFLRRVLKELDPSCVVSLATARTNILLKLALLGLAVQVGLLAAAVIVLMDMIIYWKRLAPLVKMLVSRMGIQMH